MRKEEKFGLIFGAILVVMTAILMIYAISAHKKYKQIEQVVEYVEEREVLAGEYVNIDERDYILLQVKYDDCSKLEKYSIHDIVFKDIEEIEQPYLKVYLNRYDRVLNSELYY
ncbi:MAG: hypothetical protein E7C50_00405 [Clostridium sp.]|uniref:hypothetical protein n=1 Tax=Clostridium sp. TaxID=1506 RepID=UPI0028FF17A9|nr:hypothetical protein [Clostridium sp.]MDU2674225.1 hypothetical protein [Clostridium sp.]MDU2680320.1 hypothetical protein [Clostridium sp.]